jgi:hypothetical protein
MLVGKPERWSALERSRCRWEYNIKLDLKELRWERVDLIDVAQDRDQ